MIRLIATALVLVFSSPAALLSADAFTVTGDNANPLVLTFPNGWTEAGTTLSVVEVRDGKAQPNANRTIVFKFAWKAGPPVALEVANAAKRPGTYELRAAKKDGTGQLAQQFTLRGEASGIYNFHTSAAAAAPAPAAPAGLGVAGAAAAPDPAKLAGETKEEISKLVLTEAANWDTSGVPGRRRYVKRFDTYPITSCRDIARIFRETSEQLAGGMAIKDADAAMRTKIEEFYKRGESKYRTRNPLQEDWQPFLQHLEKLLNDKYAAETISDPNVARFILGELADGFEQLANVWLEAATTAGTHDVGDQPGLNSAGTSYSSGGSTDDCHCPRCRRKRCHCARLLFR